MNKVEELKQRKTDKELINKCSEIIESLSDYNHIEKYRILTTLYCSFMDVCEQEGIAFIDVQKLKARL